MKIAIIAPTPSLNTFSAMGTCQMCLGFEALVNLDYLTYFKNKQLEGQWVLMDNGAHEGRRVEGIELVELAEKIRPSCMILPDVLDNYEDTKKDTLEFHKLYSQTIKELGVGMMAVPQGKTFEQFLDNYKTFSQLEGVDYLGISYTILFNDIPGYQEELERITSKTQKQMMRRFYLIKYLEENNIIARNKKHHLLGLANPKEFELYTSLKDTSFLHSSDSALAYVNGRACRAIDSKEGIVGEREPSLEDFSEEINLTYTQEKTIKHNTQVILDFANKLN